MDCSHPCLPVTSLDSALKKDENYYPQVFLNYVQLCFKTCFQNKWGAAF